MNMYVRESRMGERRVELPTYQKNGAQCPEVLLSGPEVRECADLLSMRMDLEHVIDMCNLRASIARDRTLPAGDRTSAMRATWEAAVIAYGRAFVGGVSAAPPRAVRTRFPESVLGRLNAAQRAVHDRTMMLRNQHVGHRVNNWTQVLVTAVLNPESEGPRSVLHLGEKIFTVLEGPQAAEELGEVATILRDGLSDRLRTIEAEIEAQLRAQPIDDLYEAARVEAARSEQLMELERQRQASAGDLSAE